MRLRILPLLAGTFLLAPLSPARGAEVQVNPVVVTLSPAARSALVTVRNTGPEPVRFDVQVSAWDQSPAGEMLLSPSQDVLAFPPLLSLAPGEQRSLRVAAATEFAEREKTFRVFLEELPPPERPDRAAQVRVLSRIGLPVFLAAARPVFRHELAGLAVASGRATFTLRNDGTNHVRPTAVKLVASAPDGTPVLERELQAWYVLAGGERRYEVKLPAQPCRRASEVSVLVTIGDTVQRARIPLSSSACSR